jgi:hypothetical protein
MKQWNGAMENENWITMIVAAGRRKGLVTRRQKSWD